MATRMSRSVSLLSIFFALFFAISAVAAGARPVHDTDCSGSRRDGHAFPLLTWLRDSAVELVFGRPASTKSNIKKSTPSSALLGRYKNNVVLRFNVTNPAEEEALSEAANRLFLDVWTFTSQFADVRLHRDDIASLRSLLPKSMNSTVLISDLSGAVAATYPSHATSANRLDPARLDPAMIQPSLGGVDNVFFSDFQPLSVVVSWLRLLEAMYPSFVETTTVGKSYEGRDIPALRIGDPEADDNEVGNRKTILVTGGLHGREWISTSTVNYLIWSFITTHNKDPMITKLLKHYDIVFVPMLNPDGYEYTWEVDRLWRKSRQTTKMRYCRGLDLDHAFGYEWEGSKTRTDPCSESYGGDQPFQAVEASQLAAWAKNQTLHNVTFVGLLDLHSYSQQILFPYTYSCSVDPPNLENLEELAAGLAKAIRLASGESYSVSSACEGALAPSVGSNDDEPMPRVEAGGGSAIDWFYHELNARYTYQIKLRDTGSYGFLLPKTEIVPTGEEMFTAMKYFGDYLLGNNGIEKNLMVLPDKDDDEERTELKKRRRA